MTYITLLSNSSSILAGGTVADFRTRLEKPLYLNNENWEIGVYRLYVPRCFDILSEDDFTLRITSDGREPDKIHLKPRNKAALIKEIPRTKYLELSANDVLSATPDFTVENLSLTVNEVKLIDKQPTINIENFAKTYVKEGEINKFDLYIHYKSGASTTIRIPEKSYRHAKELVLRMNHALQRNANLINLFEMKEGFCAYAGLARGKELQMTDHLKAILGFSNDARFLEEALLGETQANLHTGYHYGMLYTDIAEESLVGDKYFPLLAIIPLFSDKDATVATREPPRILYKKVKTDVIDIIGVSLASETGNILRYDHVKTIPIVVTLHLRKIE